MTYTPKVGDRVKLSNHGPYTVTAVGKRKALVADEKGTELAVPITDLNLIPDAVTVTISREDAESVVRDLPEASADFAFGRVALACRAALEAKRGDCWCRGCQNDEPCRVALGGAAKAEVEPHPVCVVHLAWIPCRHGHPNSPCEWRCDEASQTAVGRFHTGELSRSEALDIFKALEGS